MAAKKKAAKAGAVAAAPYVQRVISDEELRDNVRVAVDSAREAFARLQKGKAVPATVLDDKKFHRDVSKAATALKDASDALREGPKKRKRKGGLMRKLLFLVVAGGIAVAVSEDVRNKVLDTLFGKEEEFDYTSSTQPSTPAPAPTETANATG
jgi:2-keto-3-deoxy-galactonokinase